MRGLTPEQFDFFEGSLPSKPSSWRLELWH